MKKISFIFVSVLLTVAFASCDDGDIKSKTYSSSDGRTVRVTGKLVGYDSWPDNYKIVLAGFSGGAEYSSVQRVLVPDADGNIDCQLTNIESDIETIEICAVDRIRLKAASFFKIQNSGNEEKTTADVGTIDVGMFNAIQNEVFSKTCANCHGASTTAARGLYLTEGKSYQYLVGDDGKGVQSSRIPSMKRVEPGNAEASVFYRVVADNDFTSEWHYNHSGEVLSTTTRALIADWINEGAKR